MLRRKRGNTKTVKKMAKKAVPAALQTEVSNDEEWAKILEKSGLIVVDIYSEWSGPCTGMVSILKKLKMEIGGDTLSYALAKCDNITDLKRFQGKSEPTWMFIHNGQMINLLFGVHCPHFIKTLTTELERVQNGEAHEFSIPVSSKSPEEERRLKILEEANIAKEAAKKARKEAETKAKYESEMLHYTTSLNSETCLLLYPWIFKDEEGHKRDKKSSPPYVELIEDILPGNYTIEQEIRKRIDESLLPKLFEESDYILPEENKQLILDGKCMFMRLKLCEERLNMDVHTHIISLLFDKPTASDTDESCVEKCYIERHQPIFGTNENEGKSYPVVWTPSNARNKVMVFRQIFTKYVYVTHPYEDKTTKAPIILFKYDSTRKHDLKVALDLFNDEVLNFGIFEYDKPPEAKLIASSIEEFESNIAERSGYETFVCTVKKIGCEAFLSFAGIGPYHVSENPEKALEESNIYFPTTITSEEALSDDEEKINEEVPEEIEEKECS